MVYLRTVSGGFLKAESVVGLAPQLGDGGKVVGWMAVRADGSTTALAGFYSVPGRIEKALPHLFPTPLAAARRHRGFIVPYTDNGVRTRSAGPHR
jgi:hypothetical protein